MTRLRLLKILDGDDPVVGRAPAFVLAGLIIASAIIIALETIRSLPPGVRHVMRTLEFAMIFLFLMEYLVRLICAPRPLRYAFSFWGIVDFVACVPALLFFLPDMQSVRVLRLLRLARLLKLLRLSRSLDRIAKAFGSIRDELVVFTFIASLVLFLSAVGIYHFENRAQPETFSSIPASLWWALATLTTVGYGDAYPVTTGGRIYTGLVLFVGLGVIAVPVGLMTAALISSHPKQQRDTDQGDDSA